WGSDQGIYPPMSDFLEAHRIPVTEGFSEENLEKSFDRVVIGNAMSRGNPEVEAILNRGLPFISMPELIRRELVETHRNIVVAGTHGKTTTTALMAWVLTCAGLSPTFIIGGIAKNFDSSIGLGEGPFFVIEGDEYDCAFFDKRPKFIHYFPEYLIANNLEFDHADIYANLEAIQSEFRKVIRIMPGKGLLVANQDSPGLLPVLDPVYSRLQHFGRSHEAYWSYRALETDSTGQRFEILEKGQSVGEFFFPFPGEYQLQNICAVVAVARDLEIDWQTIRSALAGFQGVKRRLEYWGRFHEAHVFDDFAHHPGAIQVTLEAVRKRDPQRRLVALFEPRTNTSVRNIFQAEMSRALQVADVVVMTPLHRLNRIPEADRLDLPRLTGEIRAAGKTVILLKGYEDILPTLGEVLRPEDNLILLTNGSLGGVYSQLRDLVKP
ncbi:MAG: hypothetical protein KDI06_21595, partial [Calditrichaeota bacterium]|nr:hypothetical protein [Calditrichota bacterium]